MSERWIAGRTLYAGHESLFNHSLPGLKSTEPRLQQARSLGDFGAAAVSWRDPCIPPQSLGSPRASPWTRMPEPLNRRVPLCHPTGQGQGGTDQQGCMQGHWQGEPRSTGAVTGLSKMQEDRRTAQQTAGHEDSPAHIHINVSTWADGGTTPSCHFVWALKGPGQQQQ